MIINRFIYVYKERATRKPVYVGSAFDVEKRDREHCTLDAIPFDHELVRRGRDAFTLHTIDNVVGETNVEAMTRCVERENEWMDECGTYRTDGCFNFARARVLYDSEEQLIARNIAASASMKRVLETSEARSRMSVAATIACASSEVRSRKSEAMKKYYENPEARARTSAAAKISNNTPEALALMSKIVKKRWENPEYHARLLASHKKRWENPEIHERQSASQKKRRENERRATQESRVSIRQ